MFNEHNNVWVEARVLCTSLNLAIFQHTQQTVQNRLESNLRVNMTIPGIKHPAIPYGSFVVVSGASGFIGSHVADQALAAGYKVRGTTRSSQKNAWLHKYFQEKYGSDSFELVEVPDMSAEGAFDEVVKGR